MVNNGENADVIESILLTAVEPRRGLSKEKVKLALELDNSSDFFGLFKSNGSEDSSLSMTIAALLAVTGVAIGTAFLFFK